MYCLYWKVPKILLISPHYPPSNLAAVHRARLFALHLPSFGWEPIILTVHEDHYEEQLDYELEQLLPKGQRIEKVSALPVFKPRLIGDIGLRGFFQLRKRALDIIRNEKIDFVHIFIPSFYGALLGPMINMKTNVPFGIDYIDPWVHEFQGSDRLFSRHWFSTKVSKLLEPLALRNISLITGISEGYYLPVLQRNRHLRGKVKTAAMPYGFENDDFEKALKPKGRGMLWTNQSTKFRFVYAGALLPKSMHLLKWIFEVLANAPQIAEHIEMHFIGTMKKSADSDMSWIQDLAIKLAIWEKTVFEYPSRLPYLDVIRHLQAANGIFVLGSTESHYSPSKIFQSILSKNPVFAILHQDSTAIGFLERTNAGVVLPISSSVNEVDFKKKFQEKLILFMNWTSSFNGTQLNLTAIEAFSAKSSTSTLVDALNLIHESKLT